MEFPSGYGNYGHISTVLFSNVYKIYLNSNILYCITNQTYNYIILGCNCPLIVV